MSYEIAGRIGWLVSWFDQWRGRPREADAGPDESTDGFGDSLLDPLDDDHDLMIESVAAKHIKAAVEQLPARERQVLLLHVNSGLTYWEIADRLGLAEQAVLGELSHAYSQLRVDLGEHDLCR
jgi:RNA polymerase sigma factor (sigma-70 family)